MLDVYWGELLVSPAPLEISLNHCSHQCAYCFANLNKKGEAYTEDPAKVLRLLADYPNRSTLVARLLQAGYPVVVSNRMDPFSQSNYRQMLPILRMLVELGIPVEIQTKGGTGIDQVLEFLPPSTWYVSLAMLDDDIRRKVEPGAPSVQERLDLMGRLVDAGHTVVWGQNPMVPQWCQEPEALYEAVSAQGVTAMWMEILHFHYKQINAMKPWQLKALGQDVIDQGKTRKPAPDVVGPIWDRYILAQVYGIAEFSSGLPWPTPFYETFRAPYAKTFSVMQDFVNWCYANKQDGDAVTCQEWLDVLTPGLPVELLKLQHYLGATAHNLWRTHKIPNDMTYSDLFKIIWAEPRTMQCPARIPCFAYAGSEAEPVLDSDGLPLLIFDAGWFDTLYAEAN